MDRLICVAALLSAFGVSSCAGDGGARVDWGGVKNPAERPAQTLQCFEAGWTAVDRRSPRYPSELLVFVMLAQANADQREFVLGYDIATDGRARNIKYVEPARYLEHSATQGAIRAAAEAVSKWRWESDRDTPVYAVDCITGFDFSMGQSANP